MEQRTGIDAACWRGNLSLGAKLRQVAGVIVDGPARDIDEAREYDFPVFARTATSRTARGRIVEAATNAAITVGDVTVHPGDFVVADGSGVVFISTIGSPSPAPPTDIPMVWIPLLEDCAAQPPRWGSEMNPTLATPPRWTSVMTRPTYS